MNNEGDRPNVNTLTLLQSVNELSKYRNIRILASQSELPASMWIVLLIGGFIITIMAAMLNVGSQRYHLFLNGLMGGFIGLVFFLIISFDNPFTGSSKIEPEGFNMILAMESFSLH